MFLLQNVEHLPAGLRDFLALRVTIGNVLLLAIFGAVWNRSFAAVGLYAASAVGPKNGELHQLFVACTLGSLPVFFFPLFSASGAFTIWTALLFWAVSTPVVWSAREAVRLLVSVVSPTRTRQVLIVGSGPRAKLLYREVRRLAGAGVEPIGFVDSVVGTPDPFVSSRLIGDLAELERVLMRRVVDEVLIALPIKSCYEKIQQVIYTCERVGLQSTYLSDIFEPSRGRVNYAHALPFLSSHALPFPVRTVKVVHDDYRLVVKRGIDVVGAVIAILLCLPLLMGIAFLIKLTTPGPVFFSQQRYGLNRRLFRMYKFRTMVSDAEALQARLECRNEARGPVFKIALDPRVTRVGAFLRRTSLDELPQLWNVLRGEMSLVGPRPLPIRDVGRFGEGWLMRRFSMRPGLTCLWQVGGRSTLDFQTWMALDLEYIDNWSLTLDLVILLKTIPAVVSGEGAS